MKIALIHLSDFHIKEGDRIANNKIDRMISSLNSLSVIDDYVILFSGDLSNKGKINEFKSSRYFFGRLIAGIKEKNNNRFVNLLMVPGNHDLNLPKGSRERTDIQTYYDNGTIQEYVDEELSYLKNYYEYSNDKGQTRYNERILKRKILTFGDYTIQFNLINTALFSTLKPNDKELHYFPVDKIGLLKKVENADLCISMMHHSYEWFNWSCKVELEKAIVDNSEILLTGHDHWQSTSSLSIDNSDTTWISAAGEMKLSTTKDADTFIVIVLDTNSNSITGHKFSWDIKECIYTKETVVENKSLEIRTSRLTPLPSYVKSIKEDSYNISPDFTQYFVFPKLATSFKKKEDNEEIQSIEDLIKLLIEKKRIAVTGATNSGKTTLLKYLYNFLVGQKVPLYLSIDSHTKIKPQNFVRHLFEEQYGEKPDLYQKFLQLEKEYKVLIVDGWDNINPRQNLEKLKNAIDDIFEYVIFSLNSKKNSLYEEIKNNLREDCNLFELHIKPFFTEKRNELVKNICSQNNNYNHQDINNLNRIIDSIVQNNSGLFALNPAFIIRYTNYFILSPYQDYSRGEAVFSKIFEFELHQSIINLARKEDVDEVFIVFEEIAGHMFTMRKDVLKIDEVHTIINNYNQEYGLSVKTKQIIEIGERSKIFKETDDCGLYFANKNHLAYFIAKYMIRIAQNDSSYEGIEYAIKNICFGINSDIVLFISYLLNNTKSIMSIITAASDLLSPWDTVNLDEKNISLLSCASMNQIAPPTDKEEAEYNAQKERVEEKKYSEEIVEARGLFEYSDDDANKLPYRLIRATKYTEILCKALPAFNSKLKLLQKETIVNAIYSYPRKIVFAILRPVDTHLDEICNELLLFSKSCDIRKKDGEQYTIEDLHKMFEDSARAVMLGLFDHFAELSTSPKTNAILLNKKPEDTVERIERLLFIENSGNTDTLLKEAEALIKGSKDANVRIMVMLIVRKHLICNKNLPFSKRQKLIDRIFGKHKRKEFLITSSQ